MFLLLILCVIILGLSGIYKFLRKNDLYWEIRGVPHNKPNFLVGSMLNVIFMKTSFSNWMIKICEEHKDEPFFGIWSLIEPCLVVQSPELVKNVLVKDFNYFTDRGLHYAPHLDPIGTGGLMFVPNPEWKLMRNKMSSIFTLSKVRRSFEMLSSNGIKLNGHIKTLPLDKPYNVNDFSRAYVVQCMVDFLFGLDAQCFNGAKNEFTQLSIDIFSVTLKTAFRHGCYFLFENLVEIFKIPFLTKDMSDKFRSSICFSLAEREKSHNYRGDFIDALLEIKKEETRTGNILFHEDRLMSQPAAFFIASSVTSTSSIAFTLHELCLNPEIQAKTRHNILESFRKFGEFTFEAIQNMKYLDAVINESLRKYPAQAFLDRITSQNYVIPDTKVVVEKGSKVLIPLMAMHYSEKYFPNPQKFDPDRFLVKNGQNVDDVYMPFGIGPRFCIGKQLGLLLVKVCLVHFLTEFEVERCSDTNDPIIFEKKSIMVESNNGNPMYIKRLKK